MFNLKQPCDQCPFVKGTDMNQSLSKSRITDIVEDLLSSDTKTFTCHKTIDYSKTDEDMELIRGGKQEQMCYGSMVYLQKIDRPHVSQRLAYSMGMLNYKKVVQDEDSVIDPIQISKKRKG